MLAFEDRYSRQRRLPEVGPQGQARLAQARCTVPADVGLSAYIELLYLHRAGVAAIDLSSTQAPAPFPHEATFRCQAARELARGSHRALLQLRKQLSQST